MKGNFTTIASTLLLAIAIVFTGCDDDNGGGGGDDVEISSISPASGMPGEMVTITGVGFASTVSGNTVTFTGDVEAGVTSASTTELQVTVPEGAQDGPITVVSNGVTVSSSATFSVSASGPEIPQAYQDLPGELIAEDETWANDTTITGPRFVLPGATLTVEEGVTVTFTYHNNVSEDVGTIITLPADESNFSEDKSSGRLVAVGTDSNPVVFTSDREQVASWGGIILAGSASNNVVGGLGEIEGLSQGVQYGADIDGGESFNDDDDSGQLSYVQINYSGYSISEGSELQALTLYSVGRQTQLDHISIYQSVDDGVEFFGGTVNLKYFVVVGAQDDTFDGDQGWSGHGQFWLGVQTEGLPTNRGFENDGCDDQADCDGGNGPTEFHVYNATIWGNDNANGETMYGLLLREDITGEYKNIIIANFAKDTRAPIFVPNDGTQENVGSSLTFGGNISYMNTEVDYSSLTYEVDGTETVGYSAEDLGLMFVDDGDPMFIDAANYDFSLMSDSPAATSGIDVPSDDFYTEVGFSGAVGVSGSDDDWTTGASWIKWQ